MRAVVTGGIGGVVDTFGKSLKYATCFGKFTAINWEHKDISPRSSHRSLIIREFALIICEFIFKR